MENGHGRIWDTYLKTNDHIHLADPVLASFLVQGKLFVEDIAEDETNPNQQVLEHHHLDVQDHISGAPADQIVAAFVDKPVNHTEKEQYRKSQHFVNVKSVAKYNRKKQKLEDLLLRFVHDILHENNLVL